MHVLSALYPSQFKRLGRLGAVIIISHLYSSIALRLHLVKLLLLPQWPTLRQRNLHLPIVPTIQSLVSSSTDISVQRNFLVECGRVPFGPLAASESIRCVVFDIQAY